MTPEERKLKKYGLTKEQYKILLDYNKNRCFICNRPPQTRALHIDHDHRRESEGYNSIRGTLCFRCNKLLIGRFGDSDKAIELFESALRYLKQMKNGFFNFLKEQEKSGTGSNQERDRSEGIIPSGVQKEVENKSRRKTYRFKKRIQSEQG